MANAKLWWDGSAWQVSESFWIDDNTATGSSFGIYLGVKVMAFDDAVIRLEGTMFPAYNGGSAIGDAVLSGTKTLKADGETIGTLAQGSRNVTAVVSGTVLTATGNVATYRQVPGTPYGQPNRTNYSTTISDPFAAISFNANGGSGAPAPQTVCKGVAATLSGTVPTRSNYSFLGWSTDPSATAGTYYSGGEITVTGDTVLYAVWKANSYSLTVNKPFTATVTILKNGTAFSGATVEYGDVLTVTFTPSAGYFIDTATLNGSSISSGDTHTVTGAVTINITTVAQYSTIATFDSVVETLGTFHLTVNQYDPSHYSKIQYFDSNSTLLDTSAPFTTSTTETVPRSWFNNFPSDTQITITAVNTTYTDPACTPGTETGLTSSCTFIVTADAGMKPVFAAGVITLSPYNTGTGAANLSDPLFIKGYSKVSAVFDTTKITHFNGATAAAYAITVLSVKTSSASSTLTSSNVLTVADDITVTYSVTDTRGRSASGTETISVNDYIGPTLQPLICKRTDSGGTPDDSGTYMTIKATANYASLSDNAVTLSLSAKPAGGAYVSYGTISDGVTTLFGGGTFSPDASYVVKVSVTDTVGNSSSLELSMPRRSWDFHIGHIGGNAGAAFGKVTEYGNTLQLASGWGFRMGATTLSEAQLIKLIQLIPADPLNTFSGAIVQFNASEAKPIVEIDGNIVATQSGSGDPSPNNVRPITGYTEANIYQESAYDSSATPKQTISFSSQGTVYGGNYHVNSDGTVALTVTLKSFTYSSVSLYGTYQGHPLYYATINNPATDPIKNMYLSTLSGTLLCDRFVKTTAANVKNMLDCQIRTEDATNPSRFYFRYDSVANLATLNAELANNPMTVVAELQTPISVTLSSVTMLNTLVGTNTMWTDTGDITVTAYGEEIQINTLQSLNMLLGNAYVNNHTPEDVSDEEALDIIMGESR